MSRRRGRSGVAMMTEFPVSQEQLTSELFQVFEINIDDFPIKDTGHSIESWESGPISAEENPELYSFEDYTPSTGTISSSPDAPYSPSQEKENIFFKKDQPSPSSLQRNGTVVETDSSAVVGNVNSSLIDIHEATNDDGNSDQLIQSCSVEHPTNTPVSRCSVIQAANQSISNIEGSRNQAASLNPRSLAGLVGDSNTEITDDVVQISTNLMKVYSDELTTPYVAYYTPAEIHLFTTLQQSHIIPLDRSSINIHPLTGHWVTSCYNVHTKTISVYDSMMTAVHFIEVKRQLQVMYGNQIANSAQYINVTQQVHEPICGVMAIAFAFTCLIGEDPAFVDFDISRVRIHLRKCLLEGQMRPFPITQSNRYQNVQSHGSIGQLLNNYFQDQRNKNKYRMKNRRQNTRIDDKAAEKEKDKSRKKTQRQNMTSECKTAQKEKDRSRKMAERQNMSIEPKTAVKEKDQLRKKAQRQSMSSGCHTAELETDRTRKKAKWMKMSSEYKTGNIKKDRLKKRAQRQIMNSEQKTIEIEKDRSRKRAKWQKMSSECKTAEIEKDRSRKMAQRQHMNTERKTMVMEKDKLRKKAHRRIITNERRMAEIEKGKLRKKAQMQNITNERRMADLEKDKLRKKAQRQKITNERRMAEIEKDKLRKKSQRRNITNEHRMAEIEKDKLRKKAQRQNITNEHRMAEIEKDKLRKKAQRRNITNEHRMAEIEKDKLRKKAQRRNITNEHRMAEIEKDKLRKKAQRRNITNEHRMAEIEKDKLRKKAQRQNLNSRQKKVEIEKDQLRKKTQRQNLTGKQIRTQIEKDKERKKAERANITLQKKITNLQKEREVKMFKRTQCLNDDLAIKEFKEVCLQGPVYVCCSCMRLLYKQSVIKLNVSKYKNINQVDELMSLTESPETDNYVCKTCDKYLKRGKLPPQNFTNNLHLDKIPEELSDLSSLESRLLAQRIPFMKISARPSGGQRAISGAVVNVPVDTVDTCTHLPRPPPNSAMIMLQLKRKKEYKSSALNQYIRPTKVMSGLNYLIKNNALYTGINTNENAFSVDSESQMEWNDVIHKEQQESHSQINPSMSTNPEIRMKTIATEDINSEQGQEEGNVNIYSDADTDSSNDSQSTDDENEVDKCLPYDTCLQPSDGNEVFSIAPAEGNIPLSLLTDPDAEHLAFPVLFPKGRFGFTYKRNTKLHHRQYLNARLLNTDTRFATNTDYIFFSQFHAEKKQLLDNVQVALRKVQSRESVTAADLRSSQTIQSFVSQNIAYMLLKNIRGSPAYWQKCMYDLLAMVRQLGVFTWFLTLSSADLRWVDIIRIIAQQHGVHLSDNDVSNLTWEQKCTWLRNNPVTAARHFDYKVQQFFKTIIIKNKVLGDVTDYFIRTEFQQRGSPHVHCVLWVKNAPICGINTENEVCSFVNKYISTQLPSQTDEPELYQLVSTLQQHRHTRTCKKSGKFCRFHFPKIPVPFTLLSKDKKKEDVAANNTDTTSPGTSNLNDLVGSSEEPQPNYKQVLKAVGEYVYSCKENNHSLSLQKILQMCNITEEIYADAIRESESSVKIFHKREPCDEFVNNYNPTVMKSWEANMDLQYVTDVYACIKYIVSYVTKDERQLSDLLRNASKEANNLSLRQQLKNLGNVFLNHREVSAQEAIYRVLPIPLRRTSRSVLFVPTDMDEDRVRIVKPSHLIEHLDDDSEDIYCKSLPDRYVARPDCLENMCLAEFAASYTAYNEPPDDFQSISMTQDGEEVTKGKVIRLKNGKGYMSKRKEPCIIRTHTYSKFKDPEKYFHSKLMLYIPWREESQLKETHATYEQAFKEKQEIMRTNLEIYEKNHEIVDNAVSSLDDDTPPVGAWELINSEAIQADLEDSAVTHRPDSDSAILDPEYHNIPTPDISREVGTSHAVFTVQKNLLPDEQYRKMIRSLNKEQRQLFDCKIDWCRSYAQGIKTGIKPEPFYTYLTGGAGTGKSILIKAIYNMAVRELRKEGESPDDCTVLLLAPTGTAAFNINGNTIHSALRLPIKQHSASAEYLPLSQEKLQDLRCKFKNLALVIIDEISMVGAQELYIIHRRLMEIKGVTSNTAYFGGISILAVGDLYQLPPVCGKPVFSLPKSPMARLAGSLWMQLFKMYQLEQIMRQKDDQAFAMTLNRIRLQKHTQEDILMLKTRVISKNNPGYPHDALHMFTCNKNVDDYNEFKLTTLTTNPVTFSAKDVKPNGSQIPDTLSLPDKPSLTGGLAKQITLAVGARIMITKNIDVSDGLTNGTQGIVIGFYPETFESNNQIIAILVKCDSVSSGVQTRQKYKHLERKYPNAVPIFRDEVRVSISNRGGNYISRLQFPLRLSWACTIHKTQGMTLDKAVVSLQGKFFTGQCYVALSRVSSLNGLFITDFSGDKIKASSQTVDAMKQMMDNSFQIVANPIVQRPTNVLSISLLNVRSFTRHYQDICATNDLNFVDISCYTETWLKKEKTSAVPKKTSFRQDRLDKRSGGVLMYVFNDLQPVLIKTHSDKNLDAIAVKVTSLRFPLNIILVYVAANATQSQTLNMLQDITGKIPEHEYIILLGDFNKMVSTPVSNKFVSVVDACTTNTGSTIDQVFVTGNLHPLLHISTPYFSDHQIIWIGIKL